MNQTYQQIPDYLLNDRALKPQDIKVYSILRSHLGKNPYAFPSVKLLAKETGISTSTVDRCLRSLRQRGHIERKRVGNGKSAQTYFKTLVRNGAITTGKPLEDFCQPKKPVRKAQRIDDAFNEEMELYYIKEREDNLAATYTDYSWEDCRYVKPDVPDASNLMCADTSSMMH